MMNRLFLCRQQTTVLRGMAAIIIALFHVFIEWQLPRVVNVMGSICVALFLLLSGFGIHESYLVHLPLVPYVEKNMLYFILFMTATALLTYIYYQINHKIIAKYL